MNREVKIEYKRKKYKAFVDRDISGVNSIRDLAEDFAYDLVESLNFISCESDLFDEALEVIETAFYDLMKYGVLPAFIPKNKKPKMEFPPKNKETEIWQVT